MSSLKPRILVVDDDAELRALLQRFLQQHGFSVRTVADAVSLYRELKRSPVDAIVLDLMLPGDDGLNICRSLRAAGDGTPILMLTAKGDPMDRILGLEMGADDYLSKPFTPRELVARLHAILRRINGRATRVEPMVAFGPFTIDHARLTVSRDGSPLTLSTREFAVLSALAASPGRPLSRAQLIERAHGRDAEVTDRAIDVQIVRLRKAMGDDPANPRWIKTVWGIGYMLMGATTC